MKKWNDSASLLLVGQHNDFGNYKILTMKRSLQSSFMPNTYVFPGGKLDKADCSQSWLKLYSYFGIPENYFDEFENIKHRAPIYKNDTKNTIPKYISLRICAIRETFEECGILLCKSAKTQYDKKTIMWVSNFQEANILEWQKRVHKDAFQFIELCYTYGIYPDIWALHEWSNWLTPTTYQKRYDTIFFLACIRNIPPTYAEKTEVQITQWESPAELIRMNENLEIFLPPPQFYEISRVDNFSIIHELLEFAIKRAFNGSECFLSHVLKTKTIEATILPGDDLYTEVMKAQNDKNVILDNIPETYKMHRIYHFRQWKNHICIKNYKYNVDHIFPVIRSNVTVSKL